MKNSYLILCMALSASAFGQTSSTIDVDGITREYTVIEPKIADGKSRPILFLFHGFTGNPKDMLSYTGFQTLAKNENFFLVVPAGSGRPAGWNSVVLQLGRVGFDDFRFFDELYKKYTTRPGVDTSRVYLAGHSNGAMMINALAGRFSERIAGIGSVAGIVGSGRTAPYRTVDAPKTPVNAIFIHGDADKVVAYKPEAEALLKGMPVEEGVKFWAESLGIKNKPKIEEKAKVKITQYKTKIATVELHTLLGWSHEWSNRARGPIDSARVIWDFLKNFQKKQPAKVDPKSLPIRTL
jgi:polyhydroxybutyrate depolymerase